MERVLLNPDDLQLPRDEEGNVVYVDSYIWSTTPDPDLEPEQWQALSGGEGPEAAVPTCRYEEAPILPRLTNELAVFLEEHRDEFLNLQLKVMAACRDTVRARDADRLWPTVLSLLTRWFSIDQLWQFLQADELYRQIRLLPIVAMRCGTRWPENVSAGVTDLLRLVAHCEMETRQGVMDRTRRRLLRAPKDMTDRGCYFGAVQHPAALLLDDILDEYWDREQEAAGSWHEIGERVRQAFEEEADKVEVCVTRRVERALAQRLQEAILSFTEFHHSELRSLGANVVVQFTASGSGSGRAAAYGLRRGGQYWIAQFEDEIAAYKDSEIARVIGFLIRHQGESFHVLHAVMGAAGTLQADVAVSGQRATGADLAEEGIPGGTHKPQPIADVKMIQGLEQMIERKNLEIAEAEGQNDAARAVELKEELAEWEQHLREVKGKGGQSRDFSDDASAAQQRLSEAFRRLCRSLELDAPKFVRHLQNSIILKMAECAYRPDRHMQWKM